MSSALKICPTCSTEYPANERFCPRDGSALHSQGGGTDLVGSIIAERYHVLKKLGEGGMGQVYLAEHVKMGRKSAVKVMNPGMVHDADAISRFNREAANASRINHPNVAGIYDFGETADGLIYLAMEFIEGESLTALVERTGALSPMRAADITKQAADGLAVAHDMGIVHRDLKPDNIMIAKNRDGSDCVKVVDFGIAKAAGAENQKVTKTGLVVGTPEYMSPEQLAGDKLDGRSDIYSLALVAFNMLTGKLPFPSESAQESMIMRLTDKPKSLTEMKPDASWPPEVEAVINRALERDAGLRYKSAAEFGKDLWMAVDRMPTAKQAAAGTAVMGAATAIVDSVPKTQQSPRLPTPATSTVVPTSRSKLLMTLGGGTLVAAAAAVFIFTRPAATSPSSPAGADSSAGAMTSPPNATSSSGPPTNMTPKGSASIPPGGGGAGTTAPSTRQRISAAPSGGVALPNIGDRIPFLLTESSDDATAARALGEADALLARTTTEREIAGLRLVRAQALGLLGKDAESCDALRSIRNGGGGTPYADKIANYLKISC